MLKAFTHPNGRLTITFFLLCIMCSLAAVSIGIADNPPGFLLAILASVSGIAALVHPWRTVNEFWRLVFYSTLGLVVFGAFHTLFEWLAHSRPGTLFAHVLGPLAAISFLVAILACPAAIFVGILGTLITVIRDRRRRTGAAA